MILLAYRHGMRASEVCKLRLSDLDLKNGQITVRRLVGTSWESAAVLLMIGAFVM